MPKPVKPGDPTVRFVECHGDVQLGSHFSGGPTCMRLRDRYMTMDLDVPSKQYAVPKTPTVMFLDEDDVYHEGEDEDIDSASGFHYGQQSANY